MDFPVPILLVSDAPDQSTGLARITRDLATQLVSMPEFRVATLGYGGIGSRVLPWTQYQMTYTQSPAVSCQMTLPHVWDEFSGGQIGVITTIWDLSRLFWLARPEYLDDSEMRAWVEDRRQHLRLWSYLPIDATGPNGKLTAIAKATLLGIDRILTYSPWARDLVQATIGQEESVKRGLDWMPHGLNMKTFTPEKALNDTVTMRAGENGPVPVPVIGIVATNQARKDWGLAAATCAELVRRLDGKIAFWWHADQDIRYWSIPALIADFDLESHAEVTHPPLTDSELAARYRACSVTLHPGLGEGFGYPIFESLACGTPVVAVDYGGGASILKTCGLTNATVWPYAHAWRLEGEHNCVRPVVDTGCMADAVLAALDAPLSPEECRAAIEHLDWAKLGPRWRKWFKDGLGVAR